jgi:hypothetical protein
MLACLRWNKPSLWYFAALLIGVSGAASAQWDTQRKIIYAPPTIVQTETTAEGTRASEAGSPPVVQPPIVAPIPTPRPAPVIASPYQPFVGTSENLPKGYKPSRSAVDPVDGSATPAAAASYSPPPLANPPAKTTDEEKAPEPVKPLVIKAQPDSRTYRSVTLQGLDKVTTRRQEIKALLGTVTSFGNLEIVPHACWQAPAEQQPESATLLEIWQWKSTDKPSFVFFGWMFSSSPALSSLEHPIYDITVLQCVQDPKEAEAEAKETKRKIAEEAKAKAAEAKARQEAADEEESQYPENEGVVEEQAPLDAEPTPEPYASPSQTDAPATHSPPEATVPQLEYPPEMEYDDHPTQPED